MIQYEQVIISDENITIIVTLAQFGCSVIQTSIINLANPGKENHITVTRGTSHFNVIIEVALL